MMNKNTHGTSNVVITMMNKNVYGTLMWLSYGCWGWVLSLTCIKLLFGLPFSWWYLALFPCFFTTVAFISICLVSKYEFLYRDHRGGLKESMETVQTMSSFRDLQFHLWDLHGDGKITIGCNTIYDDRTKWETYTVCHNGRAVGYTNKKVN